jgi:hypothetical protein
MVNFGPLDTVPPAFRDRTLKAGLRPGVDVVESATHNNDPAFAAAMAERLDAHDRAWAASNAAIPPSAGGPRTSEDMQRSQPIRHAVAAGQ